MITFQLGDDEEHRVVRSNLPVILSWSSNADMDSWSMWYYQSSRSSCVRVDAFSFSPWTPTCFTIHSFSSIFIDRNPFSYLNRSRKFKAQHIFPLHFLTGGRSCCSPSVAPWQHWQESQGHWRYRPSRCKHRWYLHHIWDLPFLLWVPSGYLILDCQ